MRENGLERLNIRAFSGRAVRLEAGREGRDALAGLGLGPGVIAVNSTSRGAIRNFGLGLVAGDPRLDSKEAIAAAKAALPAAVSIVRQAMRAAQPNAKPKTDAEKALEQRRLAGGAVPEYYSTARQFRAALPAHRG